MKYSPDGRYLAVGSNDNFVDVYGRWGGVQIHFTHKLRCAKAQDCFPVSALI